MCGAYQSSFGGRQRRGRKYSRRQTGPFLLPFSGCIFFAGMKGEKEGINPTWVQCLLIFWRPSLLLLCKIFLWLVRQGRTWPGGGHRPDGERLYYRCTDVGAQKKARVAYVLFKPNYFFSRTMHFLVRFSPRFTSLCTWRQIGIAASVHPLFLRLPFETGFPLLSYEKDQLCILGKEEQGCVFDAVNNV